MACKNEAREGNSLDAEPDEEDARHKRHAKAYLERAEKTLNILKKGAMEGPAFLFDGTEVFTNNRWELAGDGHKASQDLILLGLVNMDFARTLIRLAKRESIDDDPKMDIARLLAQVDEIRSHARNVKGFLQLADETIRRGSKSCSSHLG